MVTDGLKAKALEADEREVRLPRWAQDKLAAMRVIVLRSMYERDEARLATKPEETNTFIDQYSDIPIGLPNGQEVVFVVGEDRRRDWIEVHRNNTRDCITVLGDRVLSIQPASSNLVHIYLADR